MSVLGQFLEDSCVILPAAHVKMAELYAAYESWCQAHAERPVTVRLFGKALTEWGFDSYNGTGNVAMRRGLGFPRKVNQVNEVNAIPL